MREVNLTKGYVALVDDEDYELVSQYKWYPEKGTNTYYAKGNIGNKFRDGSIRMHNLILGKLVDHINGDGLDNRRENLRLCTNSQNQMNKVAWGKSNFKGVDFHIGSKLWRSRIQLNGKSIFIGRFSSEEAAALAYDAKAKELFGDFAKLNFKDWTS
jgi:hypothetical protein